MIHSQVSVISGRLLETLKLRNNSFLKQSALIWEVKWHDSNMKSWWRQIQIIHSLCKECFFPQICGLTLWCRVTHICVTKLNIIDLDNGLSPGRRQAIFWTSDGILLIWPSGSNFNEMFIEIHEFSFKKIHLKMSSAKWRPFCPGIHYWAGTLPSASNHGNSLGNRVPPYIIYDLQASCCELMQR